MAIKRISDEYIFIGQDGSLGFKKGNRYHLLVEIFPKEINILGEVRIIPSDLNVEICVYSTKEKFLENWEPFENKNSHFSGITELCKCGNMIETKEKPDHEMICPLRSVIRIFCRFCGIKIFQGFFIPDISFKQIKSFSGKQCCDGCYGNAVTLLEKSFIK